MTRYELLDRIGVGGMAEIFRGKAVAAGGFEKPVAIKRILPHLSQDRRFVELLIAEAKVLSLLKHRNIVQIFDVGLGDDGKYFLVMEYVDGKDLRAVQTGLEVRRRRMPFDLALHIGAEVCEALEHAHTAKAPDGKQMSLVHRDVSPSNVLLSRAGEVKLTIDVEPEPGATVNAAFLVLMRGAFSATTGSQVLDAAIGAVPADDAGSAGQTFWFPPLAIPSWSDLMPGNYTVCGVPITGNVMDPTLTERRARGEKPVPLKKHLEPLKNIQVWRFSLYYIFVFGAFVALALWLPKYYVTEYGLTLQSAAFITMFFTLPSGLIRALGGWISDKFGGSTTTWPRAAARSRARAKAALARALCCSSDWSCSSAMKTWMWLV